MTTPAQYQFPHVFGYLQANLQGLTNFSLNATATWQGYSFVLSDTKTLSSVRIKVASVTGSLAATDITCAIYSDSAGNPNASLSSTTTLDSAISAAWHSWTGLSQSLTAGTRYWAVFSNANGSAASNFPVLRRINSGYRYTLGNHPTIGWGAATTVNSGGAWTQQTSPVMGVRLGFSDGTYAGTPIDTTTSANVFGNNQSGAKFTCPNYYAPVIRQAALCMAAPGGTPTGNLQFNLWSGSGGAPTLVGTTQAIAATDAATVNNGWVVAYFNTAIQLTPGGVYRITAQDTNTDSSSNCYRSQQQTVDTDSNSTPLFPVDGTAVTTSTTDGVNFTDDTTSIQLFALSLDTTGPFVVGGPLGTNFRGGFGNG